MNVLIGFLIWFNGAWVSNSADINVFFNPDNGTVRIVVVGSWASDCQQLEIKVNERGEIGYCCAELPPH